MEAVETKISDRGSGEDMMYKDVVDESGYVHGLRSFSGPHGPYNASGKAYTIRSIGDPQRRADWRAAWDDLPVPSSTIEYNPEAPSFVPGAQFHQGYVPQYARVGHLQAQA